MFSPLSVFGEERDDQVGISFKAEQPVDPKEPTEPTEPKEPAEPKDPTPYDPDPSPSDEPRWITPFNNVLPLTLGSARNYYAQESHKNLPKQENSIKQGCNGQASFVLPVVSGCFYSHD